MANFEEHLFGRIAVLNGYLTPDQLEICLRKQREMHVSSPIKIGKLLLQEGLLNEEQLAKIVDIRRKKLRRLARSAEEIIHSERRFRQRVLKNQAVTPNQLEAAVLEQQRLQSLNIQIPVWEVLVSLGHLSSEEVMNFLEEEGLRILTCKPCDLYFKIEPGAQKDKCRCERCGQVLNHPNFLDTVTHDGVIQVVKENPLEDFDFESSNILEVN